MVSWLSSSISVDNDHLCIYAIYWSNEFSDYLISQTNNWLRLARKCRSWKTYKNDYLIEVYWIIFWSWIFNSFQILNNFNASLHSFYLRTAYSYAFYYYYDRYSQYVYNWTYLYVLLLSSPTLVWLKFK